MQPDFAESRSTLPIVEAFGSEALATMRFLFRIRPYAADRPTQGGKGQARVTLLERG